MATQFYDQPVYNVGSEVIPPYAVMEVKSPGLIRYKDKEWFTVGKPTANGKTFLINSQFPINYVGGSRVGNGANASRTPGVHALYDPSITPVTNERLAPKAGQWYLARPEAVGDSVFYSMGDLAGSAPSIPGYPPSASSRRVRVSMARGSGAGLQLARFVTTAAKKWDNPYCDAQLLDIQDNPITDDSGQPIRIKVFDAAPAKHEFNEGSRGWCFYKDTVEDIDHYFIIGPPDSPARFLEGTLVVAWESSASYADVNIAAYWGASPNHLPPKLVEGVARIWDTAKLRKGRMETGSSLLAVWDEKREKWILLSGVIDAPYITVRGPSPGVTRDMGSFTLSRSALQPVNGPVPDGDIIVTNTPPLDSPGGRWIYARYNIQAGSTELTRWDTGDGGNFLEMVRGMADWYVNGQQVIDHHGNDDPHWHDTGPCTAP